MEIAPAPGAEAGFRLTAFGAALLGRAGWEGEPDSPPPAAAFDLSPTGLVRVPADAGAYDRFQLARLSDWLPPEANIRAWACSFGATAPVSSNASRTCWALAKRPALPAVPPW